MTAPDWGWSAEGVASRLTEERLEARENGRASALLTAQNAAAEPIDGEAAYQRLMARTATERLDRRPA